ncbi:hypothetical protein ECG_07446 [Echinococcus granulosus]|uniref:Expressed conserved protein n=1 Tax=Echinococcus granulosus TaxID=6210 RepID=A0A068WUG6_ECHGR|nr:hypothetical protein ECG_07446 [Echinococcus granulosus]CDS22153.1 expressed conserved protein [Echinococcus granulosus]
MLAESRTFALYRHCIDAVLVRFGSAIVQMDGRQPSLSSFASGGDISSCSLRIPDKFNFDLSDLIDDLIAFAYTDSASNAPDAGSGVVLSNLAQRITSLRASVQEAKELCRPSPRGQRTASATPASATVTAAPTPRAKATPATPSATDTNQSLSLFHSACDLDPVAQQHLLSAVATACVAKRNLLAELKQELFDLKMQNDHFSI